MYHRPVWVRVFVGLLALSSLSSLPARADAAQVTGTTGAELFANYCATCHGQDGKGKGPTALALHFQTPDLTKIASKNGGTFPADRLQAQIGGTPNLFIPAHGSSQMPVWGPLFRALDPQGAATDRIANVVEYLRSIQGK